MPPARQPWARDHGSIIRDQGEVTGSGQEYLEKSKVFTVCTRKWEISSTCHQGSFESSLLIFFAFLKLQRSPYCSPATLLCWLPWMIYWARACDNAHTTNLSAEHIDTRVCHYPLITLLTYVSIQASWQLTKLQKWPQINPQGYRAHTFIWTQETNQTYTLKVISWFI